MEDERITRLLHQRGCPENVVEAGLAGLVTAWEKTAAQVRTGYPLGLDDYLNDMDARQLIDEALNAAPDVVDGAARERIAAADRVVRGALAPGDECLWGEELARRDGWTPDHHWWYFGLPRDPGPQLRDELEDL